MVLVIFAGLFGAGIWGALNLEVEDSARSFIPANSYLTDYTEATDKYYPSAGIELETAFEGSDAWRILGLPY